MPRWINIRRHVKGLTRGDSKTIAQGKWIVLRTMRIGQYSKYWNAARQEAIGGPKWEYDDILIRTISKPGATAASVPSAKQGMQILLNTIGMENTTQKIFAIEVNRDLIRLPMTGDRVYEIREFQGKSKPTPPLHATGMFEVMNPIIDHGDYGRPEVVYLYTQRLAGVS